MNSKSIINKLRLVLSVFIVFFANISVAKFVTTYSVNSPIMQEILKLADKNMTIFVDLDNTLMIPKSSMFLHNSNPHRLFINNLLYLGQKVPQYNNFVTKWYQQRKVKLVEDTWPEYIKQLKDKGASVYGLCKMPLHLINIEKKRYLETIGLKIIFTDKINKQEIFKIKKERKWFSFFYKGIIFTGPYSKSHTLMEFFKVSNIVPKKMVFITNEKHELKKMEQNLKMFDIDFYNVLYSGVHNVEGVPNQKLIKFQQQELIQNGRWLEDDAAQIILDKMHNKEEIKSAQPR